VHISLRASDMIASNTKQSIVSTVNQQSGRHPVIDVMGAKERDGRSNSPLPEIESVRCYGTSIYSIDVESGSSAVVVENAHDGDADAASRLVLEIK
jgi:hypothetical protein